MSARRPIREYLRLCREAMKRLHIVGQVYLGRDGIRFRFRPPARDSAMVAWSSEDDDWEDVMAEAYGQEVANSFRCCTLFWGRRCRVIEAAKRFVAIPDRMPRECKR